jgi:hypothetical protein
MKNFGGIIWHTDLHLGAADPAPFLYTLPSHFLTMAHYPAHNIQGQMIIRDTETGKVFLSQMENDSFRNVVSRLYDHMGTVTFNCCHEAYQWVCDQAEIDTFVADQWAWDCFWNVYISAKSDA